MTLREDIERFWSHVDVSSSCWNYTGGLFNGYGAFWYNGKNVRAHIFAFNLLEGNVPDGMVLDHLCRNKKCVW